MPERHCGLLSSPLFVSKYHFMQNFMQFSLSLQKGVIYELRFFGGDFESLKRARYNVKKQYMNGREP